MTATTGAITDARHPVRNVSCKSFFTPAIVSLARRPPYSYLPTVLRPSRGSDFSAPWPLEAALQCLGLHQHQANESRSRHQQFSNSCAESAWRSEGADTKREAH